MENKNLLQGIDTVIVRVSEIVASKRWYQEKLGLNIIWDDAETKLAVIDTNGPTSLTLWQTDQRIVINKETTSYPIFKTQDVIVLRQELQKRGIEVGDVIEDSYVSYFFFYDPDRNMLEACQVRE